MIGTRAGDPRSSPGARSSSASASARCGSRPASPFVVLAGVLVLPSALGFGGATKGTVAVVGPGAAAVARQAVAQQRAFDVELTIRARRPRRRRAALVRDGDADVARAARAAAACSPPTTPTTRSSRARPVGRRRPPAARGSRRRCRSRPRAATSASDRQGIAFVAVVILYGQLLGYGFWVATGVVEEKSTRVVELLLSAIRPRQLLAGKVIGHRPARPRAAAR